MTKVFEAEVSKSLHAIPGVYCHKCPDHPHATPDKVDFLLALPPVGRFVGVEAKEVRQANQVSTDIVTANQRGALQAIDGAGGLAIVVVNFDRVRGVTGRVGFCIAYRWPLPEGVFNIGNGELIPRVSGGWALWPYLRTESAVRR